MDDVFHKTLEARERMLICPAPGTSGDTVEGLLAEDFREVGTSGKMRTRADGIETLLRRAADPPSGAWMLSSYAVRYLSDEACLATYTLFDWTGRKSHRATVWQRNGDVWRAVYHQGTKAGGNA
ncbi:MAG: DUF4440 domain-containing protein [Firmicutes bacterium]|nr:DUF4440 domain-containing protein [Bacillota bacterium]